MQNTHFLRDYKALRIIFILIFTLFSLNSYSHSGASHEDEEVNIYSGRKGKLIEPMLKKFESDTGIKVNLITAKSDALIKRMESEGESSPADVFITVDVGRLDRAKRMGLLQSINSFGVINKVSSKYIDKDRQWIGISNRICVRSSNNIYNQSLVASLISNHGEKKAEKLVKNLVGNFARKPSGNDRAQITAVSKGECDIAIVNHYYYILMLNSKEPEKRMAAENTEVIFLNQENWGAHVNISGVGIAKYSKNVDSANELIKYMLEKESQEWYARTNNEYPVVEGVKISEILSGWGEIKVDELSLNKLGDLNPDAVKLMDRVGWQ